VNPRKRPLREKRARHGLVSARNGARNDGRGVGSQYGVVGDKIYGSNMTASAEKVAKMRKCEKTVFGARTD